ncbi:MAG: GNAT family protein [Vulcanimicrobiaceae bacterium]|jgi:ribosomal protein S18 acetylase RimI-like enzyme
MRNEYRASVEIEVRPASANDVDFIVSAQEAPHARGFLHHIDRATVLAALDQPDRRAFIVTEAGERAGVMLFGYDAALPWLVEFRRVAIVRPGRGIGTAALRWAIEWCFNTIEAHRLWLEVVESNLRARALYERLGFIYEGAYRDGFRNADGGFEDLCVYGMLASDQRQDLAPS